VADGSLAAVEARGGVVGWRAAFRTARALLALFAALLVLALGAPGAGAAESAEPPTVRILAASVDPPSVQVLPGDTVIWINESGGTRSIVANDASFDSGEMAPGDRFQFAFTEARTVTYTVNPGAGVTGTVVVTAPGTTPVAPTTPTTPAPTPPTDMAYTGVGAALTGLGGALALAIGGWFVLSGRVSAFAWSGLGSRTPRDDLLPTRRHRRQRRDRSRRARSRR
jgi:plastocyanin